MSATTEFDTIDLYSHWASALVNNDWSGLDDEDAQELRDALSALDIDASKFVDVSGETFFGSPDCDGLQGDIATYTYIVSE
jgi:hypothetical protein